MKRSKYKLIVQALAEQIRTGAIPAGARLPTHRDLAYKHGMSLGTATRVYIELFQLGLATGEIGRGTFARAPVAAKASTFHYDLEGSHVIDLSRNFMVLAGQAHLLEAAAVYTASHQAEELLHYQPHAGRETDRRVAARWLSEGGIDSGDVDAPRVLICNGGQHGLALSLLATTQPGDLVAVEAFTYPGLKVLADILRIQLAPVAMDQSGIIPSDLDRVCNTLRVKAVYCMPTMQNPLGIVMPLERRTELVAVAIKHNLRIIEDDAYGFLISDSPPPLIKLAPDRTFYLRTVSKSLAPGIRVAFLVVPEKDVAQTVLIIRATVWTAPPLMAGIVTRWLDEGVAARLISEKRSEAIARRRLADAVLAGFEVGGDPSSMHIWLRLPHGCRTDNILVAARERGVLVSPAGLFSVGEGVAIPQAVRVCLGAAKGQADLKRALTVLAEVLQAAGSVERQPNR